MRREDLRQTWCFSVDTQTLARLNSVFCNICWDLRQMHGLAALHKWVYIWSDVSTRWCSSSKTIQWQDGEQLTNFSGETLIAHEHFGSEPFWCRKSWRREMSTRVLFGFVCFQNVTANKKNISKFMWRDYLFYLRCHCFRDCLEYECNTAERIPVLNIWLPAYL